MILIIDNYDSFTYNLVHLVAAHTSDYRVVRNDAITVEQIRELAPERILISPGPGRPEHAGITEEVVRQFGPDIPILGVCLGLQAIGHVYGADVIHAPELMHGKTSEISHDSRGVFERLPADFTATRYHSLVLDPETIPESLEVTARTSDQVIMGLRHKEYPVEGIQFHPESILTETGPQIIANWITPAKLAKSAKSAS